MCGFQLFTILGVKEKPLPKNLMKTPPMKLKDMFRVLFKNDQLLWSALVMLLFNIGTNVVGGGLGMMYVTSTTPTTARYGWCSVWALQRCR
mgnify:FL=1